ncbi:MAG: type II toxin-antitoxin system VapC family toxin [Armatimonadota bacterium]|nr:type II toxin-antitoxin system VapC family toxin [Armatimonadota bacterium]
MTIDASVFVASIRTQEINHGDSLLFLSRLPQTGTQIYCHSLLVPECSASIARRTGNVVQAEDIIEQVQMFPNLHLLPLTRDRAQQAAKLAMNYRLRGADAVYLAVAEEFETTLVTWDGEMRTRGAGVVTTLTPTEWLAAQTGAGN